MIIQIKGELRFKNAIGVKPWDGILKAWDYSPACLQFRLRPVKQTPWTSMHTQSENCLYLNIWSPIETKNNTKLKTVMVWDVKHLFYLIKSNS